MPEYPHTFTSQLKGQNVVEHDRCEFEIDVEADDADVSWSEQQVDSHLTSAILCPGTEMARRSPWRRGAWRSWWRGRSGS